MKHGRSARGRVARETSEPRGDQDLHTIAFFSIGSCLGYFAYSSLTKRSDRRAAIAGVVVVAGEALVYALNGFRCPLTDLAERLGSEHGSVADIYLPRWIEEHLPYITGPIFAGSLMLHARNILRSRRQRSAEVRRGSFVVVSAVTQRPHPRPAAPIELACVGITPGRGKPIGRGLYASVPGSVRLRQLPGADARAPAGSTWAGVSRRPLRYTGRSGAAAPQIMQRPLEMLPALRQWVQSESGSWVITPPPVSLPVRRVGSVAWPVDRHAQLGRLRVEGPMVPLRAGHSVRILAASRS